MSNASGYTDTATTDRATIPERFRVDPARPVRFIGFWTAVLVPFALLSLLVLGKQSPQLLTALMAANVAGLVLGNDYKR